MDKLVLNHKGVKNQQQHKNKKKQQQQPLKVVYITNPVKFKTSASEFRALVQELTGQDADLPEYSHRYAANSVGEAAEKVGHVHAEVLLDQEEEENMIMMNNNNNSPISYTGDQDQVQNGSDLVSDYGSSSYEDVFYVPEMVDNFPALVTWHDRDAAAHQHLDHENVN